MPIASSRRFAASWPEITPPSAPREDLEIRQLGRRRIDAYAWMKFIPSTGSRTLDGLPPRLRRHLEAEIEYAQGILDPLAADADRLCKHMAMRAAGFNEPLPASSQGWRYDVKLPAGHTHRIFSRSAPDGTTQELFEETCRASGHAYYRATGHQPSPDDRYFAWAEDIR